MKKTVSFLLALGLILSLSACGKVEITMQEIYDASHLNALLEKHESVYVRNTESGNLCEESCLSKDYTYVCYNGAFYGVGEDIAFFTTDHAYYCYYEGDYERVLILTPDGMIDNYRAEDGPTIVFGEGTERETIHSVTKKDNRITVTSSLDQETIKELGAVGVVSSECEYVLDGKSRELIYSRSVSRYDDGSVYDVVSEFFYDGETPDGLKKFLEYDQQTENLRTITVVSNPGATNEKSQSVQVPKGLIVTLEPDLGTDKTFTMYSDAACTKRFAFSENYNSDATIYVKWSE